MTDCKFITKCRFFSDMLDNVPTASDLMKRMYCQKDYEKCARYRVAMIMGPENIPNDMFPQDMARAAVMLFHGS